MKHEKNPIYIGQVFGRWTVLAEGWKYKGNKQWICSCSCGGKGEILSYNLKSGASSSCGCLTVERSRERMTTHGMTPGNTLRPPEYTAWSNMRSRCSDNSTPHNYKYYAGIGIKVCDRWLKSFENFYTDMGPRPSDKHTIDRINSNGNYEPGNCRWATWTEQQNNKLPELVCRRNRHSLTPENTYRNPNTGKRLCRICHRERGRKYREAA